jgi:hypothetical protein
VCLKKLDGWEQDDDPWYVELCFENLAGREGWCCIITFVAILLVGRLIVYLKTFFQ